MDPSDYDPSNLTIGYLLLWFQDLKEFRYQEDMFSADYENILSLLSKEIDHLADLVTRFEFTNVNHKSGNIEVLNRFCSFISTLQKDVLQLEQEELEKGIVLKCSDILQNFSVRLDEHLREAISLITLAATIPRPEDCHVVDFMVDKYHLSDTIKDAMNTGLLLTKYGHFMRGANNGYQHQFSNISYEDHLSIVLMCLYVEDYNLDVAIKSIDEAAASDSDRMEFLYDVINEVNCRRPDEFIESRVTSKQLILIAQYASDTLGVFNRMPTPDARRKMREIYPLYLKNNAVSSWLPWF